MLQKSKSKWICDGDENTHYFHGILKNRNRICRINGISINGYWVSDPQEIKTEVHKFYADKFHEHWPDRPKFISDDFKKLTPYQKYFMESPFSIKEIQNAVWCCGGEKLPGRDDFSFKLIKSKWDIMNDGIIRFIKHFVNTGSIAKGCNSSFITLIPTLIPKVSDPSNLGDYIPISLLRCIYKIIAKLLALHLK